MAFNEIMTYILCFGIFVCGFMVGELRARAVCAEKTEKLGHEKFNLGWSEAKRYYYLDRKAEDDREKYLLEKENSTFNPITSDLLMAYGVTRIAQLPRKIREMYNVKESDMNIDLDTLIQRESEETVNDI